MWQQICLKNGENISHILGHYIEALTQAKEQIDAENETALYSMFEDSRDYRNSMPNSSAGPIKSSSHCIVISLMRQEESLRLPQSLPAIISVLKILGSSTTVNLKKGFSGLNFMMKILPPTPQSYFRNTAM